MTNVLNILLIWRTVNWFDGVKSCHSRFFFFPNCDRKSHCVTFCSTVFKFWRTKLSTSIYDLVLIYVCHFHHHPVIFLSNHGLSRYSCLHLGSLHPRIFLVDLTNFFRNSTKTRKVRQHWHFNLPQTNNEVLWKFVVTFMEYFHLLMR